MEEVRMVLFAAMFAILGWYDFHTRRVNDKIFLIFGSAGAFLYLFDWESIGSYAFLTILACVNGALMLRMFKVIGTGDAFAIVAGGIIYPIYLGFIPTMLLIYLAAAILSVITALSCNAYLNFLDVMWRGSAFGDVAEGRLRKCAAFLLVHRQRRFDKHAFLSEHVVDGKRKLVIGGKRGKTDFAPPSETQYVAYAIPFITMMAVAAVFFVVFGTPGAEPPDFFAGISHLVLSGPAIFG